LSFDEADHYTCKADNAKLAIIKSGRSKGKFCIVLSTSDYILSSTLKFHTVLVENKILKYANKNLLFM
jgi:hypothetical protein